MQTIDKAVVHDEVHAAMSAHTTGFLFEVGGEDGAAVGLRQRIANGITDETM